MATLKQEQTEDGQQPLSAIAAAIAAAKRTAALMKKRQEQQIKLEEQDEEEEEVQVTTRLLEDCTKVVNYLLAFYDSGPFVIPVPKEATFYHAKIKQPMDFFTLERNLYAGKYRSFKHFEADLQLIWSNALSFNHKFDIIYKQAAAMKLRYEKMKSWGGFDRKLDIPSTPVELLPPPPKAALSGKSALPPFDPKKHLYITQAILTTKRRPKTPTQTQTLYREVSEPLRQWIVDPPSSTQIQPYPRLYICKNRTNLKEAARQPGSCFTVLWDTTMEAYKNKSLSLREDLLIMTTNVTYGHPVEESISEWTDPPPAELAKSDVIADSLPRAYAKFIPLHTSHKVTLLLSKNMESVYFRRVHSPLRVDFKPLRTPMDEICTVQAAMTKADEGFVEQMIQSLWTGESDPMLSGQPGPSARSLSLPENVHNLLLKSTKYKVFSSPYMKSVDATTNDATMNNVNGYSSNTSNNSNNDNNNSTSSNNVNDNYDTDDDADDEYYDAIDTRSETGHNLDNSQRQQASSSSTNTTSVVSVNYFNNGDGVWNTNGTNSVDHPNDNNNDSDNDNHGDGDENNSENDERDDDDGNNYDDEDDEDNENDQVGDDDNKNDDMNPSTGQNMEDSDSSKDNDGDERNGVPTSKKSYEEQVENYKVALGTYRQHTTTLFEDLITYAKSKGVDVVNVKKYLSQTTSYANAEGYFKEVRYVKNDKGVVVQTFRRMTTSQRAIEIISLLKLKSLPNMPEILEVLHAENDNNEVIGLSMRRYQRTLKQYTHAHSHHRLTAHQKMDLIRQMLACLVCIHENGIAHRDLSEVNFMVDPVENKQQMLADGSAGARVYLIDFGKAIFTHAQDVRRWWIEPIPRPPPADTDHKRRPMDDDDTPKDFLTAYEYEGEVIPTQQQLDEWCSNLPWVKVKPDHGYRHYRSVQTLPRTRTDRKILPWLVDPMAEDMYSMGTLMWKVFSETEPWHGILDTDLGGLRDIVDDDDHIRVRIEREVHGDLSRQLLLHCIKTQPEDRFTAKQVVAWLDEPGVTEGLLAEWTKYAPTERKKRHAKSAFEFEEEQARDYFKSSKNPQNAQLRKMKKRQAALEKQRQEKEQRKKERERVRLELQKQKQEEREEKKRLLEAQQQQQQQQQQLQQQQHAYQWQQYYQHIAQQQHHYQYVASSSLPPPPSTATTTATTISSSSSSPSSSSSQQQPVALPPPPPPPLAAMPYPPPYGYYPPHFYPSPYHQMYPPYASPPPLPVPPHLLPNTPHYPPLQPHSPSAFTVVSPSQEDPAVGTKRERETPNSTEPEIARRDSKSGLRPIQTAPPASSSSPSTSDVAIKNDYTKLSSASGSPPSTSSPSYNRPAGDYGQFSNGLPMGNGPPLAPPPIPYITTGNVLRFQMPMTPAMYSNHWSTNPYLSNISHPMSNVRAERQTPLSAATATTTATAAALSPNTVISTADFKSSAAAIAADAAASTSIISPLSSSPKSSPASVPSSPRSAKDIIVAGKQVLEEEKDSGDDSKSKKKRKLSSKSKTPSLRSSLSPSSSPTSSSSSSPRQCKLNIPFTPPSSTASKVAK